MSDSEHNRRIEPEDIVEGEIVAEFSDETLMNLPPVPDEDDELAVAELEDVEANSGRRRLITRLVLGGAAALAVGGGAALIVDQRRRSPTFVVLPHGSNISADDSTNVAALVERVTQLEYDLAVVTAERDQLLSNLNSTDTDLLTLRTQLEEILAQLEEAQKLNDMWQSMDDIGLDALLRAALVMVGSSLTALQGVIGLLQSGLAKAQTALEQFIEALPGPQDGIRWLQQQVSGLAQNLEWLGEQVQEAVEPVEPFTNLITEFILWVLDRLPFGAGNKARAGMEAMKTVVNSLPDMVEGINSSVLDPLAEWFGQDESSSLFGILLNPVTEYLVETANDTLSEFSRFQQTYTDRLVSPVEGVLEERAALRDQIKEVQVHMIHSQLAS